MHKTKAKPQCKSALCICSLSMLMHLFVFQILTREDFLWMLGKKQTEANFSKIFNLIQRKDQLLKHFSVIMVFLGKFTKQNAACPFLALGGNDAF